MKSFTQEFKREYRAWNKAKNSGLQFCKTWNEFSQFLKDMGTIPENCDGLILSDKNKGYNKFNSSWAKVKRGAKPNSKSKSSRTKKNIVEDGMSFCLTLNTHHYAYIKRQAILRSQQTGSFYSTNDLIREALNKAYPYSGQFDMFGGLK